MELKASTKERGQMLGWSNELIGKLEASALHDATVANLAYMRLAAECVDIFVDKVNANPDQMSRITFNFIRTRSERGV